MDALRKLRKSLRDGTSVCISISKPEACYYRGIVAHLTKRYVALQQIDDFQFNGTVVIALNHIAKVQAESYSRATDRVMEHIGELKKFRPPAWPKTCETWEDLFSQLRRRNIWPSAEVVQKQDVWFLIGPIVNAEEEGSYIQHFGGEGRWLKRPDPIAYKYLRLVIFGDRYSRNFNRYMKSLNNMPASAV
jgi:hypothetical protein